MWTAASRGLFQGTTSSFAGRDCWRKSREVPAKVAGVPAEIWTRRLRTTSHEYYIVSQFALYHCLVYVKMHLDAAIRLTLRRLTTYIYVVPHR
jgi:hypothetical protein